MYLGPQARPLRRASSLAARSETVTESRELLQHARLGAWALPALLGRTLHQDTALHTTSV